MGVAVGVVAGEVVDLPEVDWPESVVRTLTWQLGGEGARSVETDLRLGLLSEDPVLQVRATDLAGPPSRRFPVPAYPADPETDPALVRDAAVRAITAMAPEGWRRIVVECRATVRYSELSGTVTLEDGARMWSPPLMVGQWLHRWRMAAYSTLDGTWHTARLEISADGTAVDRTSRDEPVWLSAPDEDTLREVYADELRLLPVTANAIPPWLLKAALEVYGAQELRRPDPAVEPERLLFARVFDGRDEAGKPVWYRPVLPRREWDEVVDYLSAAPLVLSAPSLSQDPLSDNEEPEVPRGFHTDGTWVWSSAVWYHLKTHGVPPAPALLDHIRERGHRLPARVPTRAQDKALRMVQRNTDPYWGEDLAWVREQFTGLLRAHRISTRFISPEERRLDSWWIERVGDWWETGWSDDPATLVRFPDGRQATAYVTGQLLFQAADFQIQLDEVFPAWQCDVPVLSELDPGLDQFTDFSTVQVDEGLELDRYGDPEGNLFYAAGTPFEQRGLPEEHAGFEYRAYRTVGTWTLVTALTQAGGRVYLPYISAAQGVLTGSLVETTSGAPAAPTAPSTPSAPSAPSAPEEPGHPGLPEVTDEMRAEAARTPGGWLYCADPDVDPRHFTEVPTAAMLGAYEVGRDGRLTGTTWVNDAYLPSPARRGFPAPQTDFEQVLGFAAAGWLPHERIPRAFLDSPFHLETDGAGNLRLGLDAEGRRFLVLYSSPRFVPEGAQSVMQAAGRALLPALPGVLLAVNPGGGFGLELPGDDVVAAAR